MSTPTLDRVQDDLNVIRSAISTDFPYDRGTVALNLLAGACGIPLALRAVPGWDRPMLLVLAVLIAVLFAVYGGWLQRIRSERSVRPRRWSWNREETVCSIIAIVGLVGYVLLTRWSVSQQGEWSFAEWRGQIAGPVMFGFGVALVTLAVVRVERRSGLGWGLPVLAVGLAAPWLQSAKAFHLVCGGAIFLGGLLSAAMLWRQVREAETAS